MIKINLISKKSRTYKSRDWTKTIAFLLFGLLGLYFISATAYVLISMSVIKGKIAKTNSESIEISNTMLGNSEKLSRFVLTKLILSKIYEIDKEKFHYKDYLDQISLLLPNGSLLSSVNFTSKGWISVSVSSIDVTSFNLLEKSLIKSNKWLDNKYFSSAYIEDITRDQSGSYSTSLQLELKNLNG